MLVNVAIGSAHSTSDDETIPHRCDTLRAAEGALCDRVAGVETWTAPRLPPQHNSSPGASPSTGDARNETPQNPSG